MVIIALLYIGLAWLLFFRFKLLPWSWPWRIITALVGVGILAVFMALLNYLTPSGRIAVVGRVGARANDRPGARRRLCQRHGADGRRADAARPIGSVLYPR